MNSMRNAVASVLRLVAVGLLLLGVVMVALAYAAQRQEEGAAWQWILGVGGCVVGLALIILSPIIARAVTRDYD